jgi:hypothetical protein
MVFVCVRADADVNVIFAAIPSRRERHHAGSVRKCHGAVCNASGKLTNATGYIDTENATMAQGQRNDLRHEALLVMLT